MGRPPIQRNFRQRWGTFHSLTVKQTNDGEYAALARICYLDDDGEWHWANRLRKADSPEKAESELRDRLFNVLGCSTQEETNRLTHGLHIGHKRMTEMRSDN